ncbi:MAG: sulfurtransferase TusA family protein [Dehalococcoidaceae bacterium]|nr:sulfurtransferase TusA family protein [Dehalococcoidaceae bacterium]
MIELDVRGYSRGIPLIKLQKTVENHTGEAITVYADTAWTVEDVTRYAQQQGFSVVKSGQAGDYIIILTPIKN